MGLFDELPDLCPEDKHDWVYFMLISRGFYQYRRCLTCGELRNA